MLDHILHPHRTAAGELEYLAGSGGLSEIKKQPAGHNAVVHGGAAFAFYPENGSLDIFTAWVSMAWGVF